MDGTADRDEIARLCRAARRLVGLPRAGFTPLHRLNLGAQARIHPRTRLCAAHFSGATWKSAAPVRGG